MKLKNYFVFFFIVALLSGLLAVTVYGALSSGKTVSSSGKIVTVNLGVFSNSGCTQTASSIDWGNLQAGATKTFTVWVKNTGNSNITLSMATTSWSPSNATQSIALS
jgi:archaellum component FlaG (FlaF/FlaG flagellin family)